MNFRSKLERFQKDESGQDLLEYAMVLAAVLAVVVSGSGSLSTWLANGLSSILTVVNSKVAAVS